MPDQLAGEDLARFLAPIWQAEALALARIDEALEDLKTQPYGSCWNRAAQLHQAKAFLRARFTAFHPACFHDVIERVTGEVLRWPPVLPTEAMRCQAVESLWATRAAKAPKREPARRSA